MEKGTLLLRISSTLEDDYYEIAAALTRVILSKQKIHDTLLFMTLLQTSLRDLKRRGFNVDRIMNARRAEQEAIEQKQREQRAEADMRKVQQAAGMEKAAPPRALSGLAREVGLTDYTTAYHDVDRRSDSLSEKRPLIEDIPKTPSPALPPTSSKSLFNSLRSKLKSQNPLIPPSMPDGISAQSPAGPSKPDSLLPPPLPARGGSVSDTTDPKSQGKLSPLLSAYFSSPENRSHSHFEHRNERSASGTSIKAR